VSRFQSFGLRGRLRHPVVTRVRDARERSRVAVSGTIRRAERIAIGPSLAYLCQLDDGTGEIGLLFVDRPNVPGLEVGARCSVEGTARLGGRGLQLWNPTYRLDRTRDGSE
jgi:hypothetical protein